MNLLVSSGRNLRHFAAALVAAALSIPAVAQAAASAQPMPEVAERAAWRPDRLFVQLGRATDATTATVGLTWSLPYEWRVAGGRLSAYTEASIGHWRVDDGTRGTVTQLGFTPVARWWFGAEERWFAELGVGVNVLAPIYKTEDKRFSTAFNFGDHLAIGRRHGTGAGWEWSLRVQHFSNAGIERPNPGEDFLQLRLAMPLD